MWHKFSSFISLLVLSMSILMCILFCFEMKAWGFTQMELSIIFGVCVIICYAFTSIVLNHHDALSTLWLVTVLMVLVIVLQVASITLLKEVLQTFFVL